MELKRVRMEDAKLLFLYRNEEETRRNSKTQEPVLWENHIRWLAAKVESKDCFLYLALEEDKPVGQIRIDIEDNKGTISYSVDKEYRGKGYGKAILKALESEIKDQETLNILKAEVKPCNQPSQKCFESIGYRLFEQKEDIWIYHKKLG